MPLRDLPAFDPSQIVIVGDSYPIDIVGAANAGMRTVWFNPRRLPAPTMTDGAGPDAVISSLRDLPSLFSPGRIE